jgi:hypothetical protein
MQVWKNDKNTPTYQGPLGRGITGKVLELSKLMDQDLLGKFSYACAGQSYMRYA